MFIKDIRLSRDDVHSVQMVEFGVAARREEEDELTLVAAQGKPDQLSLVGSPLPLLPCIVGVEELRKGGGERRRRGGGGGGGGRGKRK